MNWPKATLDDYLEPVSTVNARRQFGETEFPYVDLGSVDRESKQIRAATRTTGIDAPSRARQLLASGDVLVSTVRPNLNAVACVEDELDGSIGSTGFAVLRAKNGLDRRYLFHWVQSPGFVDRMVQRATGASYPAVSDGIVRESLIPLPPPDEQRRLARILDLASSLRIERRRALAKLSQLPQSILSTSLPTGPVERCALENLVVPGDRINYGVVQPGDHVEGGVPLIRAGDLVGGKVRRDKLKAIDPSIDASYRRSRVGGNEILLSCVGSIGVVAIASNVDIGSNIVRAVARIPIASARMRTFVAAYLETPSVQRYFMAELRTVAQPTLNIKQIRAVEIPVPTDLWVRQFAARVATIDRVRERHVNQLVGLDALFACLQHHAFTGALSTR